MNRLEEPAHSECVPSTSATTSLRGNTAFQQRPKEMTMREKLAREFHEHKMKCLKEDEMKMRILQVELDMRLYPRAMIKKNIQE